jgi:hypothetical protein
MTEIGSKPVSFEARLVSGAIAPPTLTLLQRRRWNHYAAMTANRKDIGQIRR